MDLNHIELPLTAIADLYHSSLVGEEGTVSSPGILPQAAPPQTELHKPENTVTAEWRSLGDNQKHILIIVRSEGVVHLPDNELQFLTGILGACKLTLADVAIVNIRDQPADYKTLTNFFKSRIVLLFDTDPVSFGLPINFPHYQIQAYAGNSFIHAPSLKALENDRLEKSKLWVSLKRLFNL